MPKVIDMDHISVLIGDSEKVIIEVLTEVIQEVAGEDCILEVRSAWKHEELLLFADTAHIDLFVLTLNNILYQDAITSMDQHIQVAQQLISTLKEQHSIPVITLGGLSEFAGKAEEAGAEYFFNMPFKLNELRDAVRRCLNLPRR